MFSSVMEESSKCHSSIHDYKARTRLPNILLVSNGKLPSGTIRSSPDFSFPSFPSIRKLGYTGIYSVHLTDIKFRVPPAYASELLSLKSCTNMPISKLFFNMFSKVGNSSVWSEKNDVFSLMCASWPVTVTIGFKCGCKNETVHEGRKQTICSPSF